MISCFIDFLLCLLALCLGKTKEALGQYMRALEVNGKHGTAYSNLAAILETDKVMAAASATRINELVAIP